MRKGSVSVVIFIILAFLAVGLVILVYSHHTSLPVVSSENINGTLSAGFPGFSTSTVQLGQNSSGSVSVPSSLQGNQFYIFVDEATYDALTQKINRLASDIKSDLAWNVIVQHGNYHSPMEIRQVLRESYTNHLLAGSILIGSIPTFTRGNFYTDWFYENFNDVDCPLSSTGSFPDTAACNALNSVSRRTVFTGRITPPVNATDEIALIGEYLDKDHAYRQGAIHFPKQMLLLPSVSLLDRNTGQSFSQSSLADDISYSLNFQDRYDEQNVDVVTSTDYLRQRQDYLTDLTKNRYETALIYIHGLPDSESPSGGINPHDDIMSSDIASASPNIFFNQLISCSNGAFKEPDYLAGAFLFHCDSLIVTANTVETVISGFLSDPPVQPTFFQPLSFLSSSRPLGEMIIHDDSLFVTQIFGDPTLRILGNDDSPGLTVSAQNIDFGSVADSAKPQIVSLVNTGSSDISLSGLPLWGLVIDGKTLFNPAHPIAVIQGHSFMGFNISGLNYQQKFILKPGQKLDLSVTFSPATQRFNGNIVSGIYSDTYSILTSDPGHPIIDLDLRAEQESY